MSFTETVKSTAPAFTLILSGLLLGKIDYQIDQIEKKSYIPIQLQFLNFSGEKTSFMMKLSTLPGYSTVFRNSLYNRH